MQRKENDNMKRPGFIAARRTLVAVAVTLATMGSAHAFKADTHVWIGQQVINDLARTGMVTIRLNGRLVSIAPPAHVVSAILNNKDDYLMGNIGPDAAPDIVVGQTIAHPGPANAGDWGTDQWLQYLLANSANNTPGQAYTYGYLGHASADVFAHTYVNQYAGDTFELDAGGDNLVETRHIALESFIAKLTPARRDHLGQLLPPVAQMIPGDAFGTFVRDTLVMNDTVQAQYARRSTGAHLAAYYEFRKAIGAAAANPAWNKVDAAVLKVIAAKYNVELSTANARKIIDKINAILPTINSATDKVQAAANEINALAMNTDQAIFGKVIEANQTMLNVNAKIVQLHIDIARETGFLRKIKDCGKWYYPGYTECKSYNATVEVHNRSLQATISALQSTLRTQQQAVLDAANAVKNASLATQQFLVTLTNAQIDLTQRFGANTSPIKSLLIGWGGDIDLAMREYVKATSKVVLNSTTVGTPADVMFAPMVRWYSCHHRSILGMPQEISGCALTDAATKAYQAVERMVSLIDDLGSMGSLLGLPSSTEMHDWKNSQIESARNRLMSYAARSAMEQLPPSLQDLIKVSGQDMSDSMLNSYYTTTELRENKRLLLISDVAARVRADMHIAGGSFDPERFSAVANAVQLAKLALLDNAGLTRLAQLANVPSPFVGTNNLVAGAFTSIDGNHQWMTTPPPRPNHSGAPYAPTPSYATAAGFTPWQPQVRNALFRALFTAPLSSGLEDPYQFNIGNIIKGDYPYRPGIADPYPDDGDAYLALAQQLYVTFLGRPAEPAGLAGTINALRSLNAPTAIFDFSVAVSGNPALRQFVDAFANSGEAIALNGAGTEACLRGVYRNAFGREPDADGLAWWLSVVSGNSMSAGQAALAIASTSLFTGDGAAFSKKSAVAVNFGRATDTAAEVNAYSGTAAAGKARAMLSTVTSATDPVAFKATVDATLARIVAGN